MKKVIGFFLIFFMCLSGIIIGKTDNKTDSLKAILLRPNHDTVYISTYFEIGNYFITHSFDSALHYYEKGLSIIENNLKNSKSSSLLKKLSIQKIKALSSIGNVYNHIGNKKKALNFYKKAIHIAKENNDKLRISVCYNDLGSIYIDLNNPDKAIEYFNKSLEIKKEIDNNVINIAKCYSNIALAYHKLDSFELAITYNQQAISIALEINNKEMLSKCYNNIGNIYSNIGVYDKAIDYFYKSLKIDEELKNKAGIAKCYNNIGIIYYNQKNFEEAINYFHKSFTNKKEVGDKVGMSSCYNNIGLIYQRLKKYDKAIDYFVNSLTIDNELCDTMGMSICYNNIGITYKKQRLYKKALSYYQKALLFQKALKIEYNIAAIQGNMTLLYIALRDSLYKTLPKHKANKYLDSALIYGNEAYNIAKKINALPVQKDVSSHLKEAYQKMGKYKKSVEFATIYMNLQDTIFSKEKTKALAEMSTKYESEKKQLKIDNLNKKYALKQAKLEKSEEKRKKQQVIIYLFILGIAMVIVFFIVTYRLYKQKQKANNVLIEQKEEITSQRDEIAAQRDTVQNQKNLIENQKQEIDHSINYAKRIQTAVFPSQKCIKKILQKYFIIFRPKDVVSGDFYWVTKVNDFHIIALADCTGHGVPGAFMSMLGMSFLNEIVRKKEETNPANILTEMRNSVIEALKQTDEENIQMEGMDMSVLVINTNKNTYQWAGANHPLWIIKNQNIHKTYDNIYNLIQEVSPDKMTVAAHYYKNDFTTHTLNIQKGDRLYFFTDGYPDQYGGEKGKKLKIRPFRKLIAQTASLPIEQQGIQLEKNIDMWMNDFDENYEQIDDITVIGIEI